MDTNLTKELARRDGNEVEWQRNRGACEAGRESGKQEATGRGHEGGRGRGRGYSGGQELAGRGHEGGRERGRGYVVDRQEATGRGHEGGRGRDHRRERDHRHTRGGKESVGRGHEGGGGRGIGGRVKPPTSLGSGNIGGENKKDLQTKGVFIGGRNLSRDVLVFWNQLRSRSMVANFKLRDDEIAIWINAWVIILIASFHFHFVYLLYKFLGSRCFRC